MCSTPHRRPVKKSSRSSCSSNMMPYEQYSSMISRSNASYQQRQIEKRNYLLSQPHPHVKAITLSHFIYPSHIIRIKDAIEEIAKSETLKITVINTVLAQDILSTCHILGHQCELEEKNDKHMLYITRMM